jgi:hypothetical protein
MRWLPAWSQFRAAINISGTIVLAAPTEGTSVFKIKTMKVNGPVLQGSTVNNMTTTYGVSGDALVKVVHQFRKILAGTDLSDDDREAIEVDVDVIEQDTRAAQPKPKRLRALLLRLGAALTTGALAGIEAGTKQETLQASEMAQKALGTG